MLSDRRQKVLAALIEEYVARALPVGSRTLTERYQLGVSPATVRNELSVLEGDGYITQPHTSAGRIPTDFGYRTFVDNLLASDLVLNDEEYQAVAEKLRQSATELDTLLEHTSAALARLTDCLSIVLAPSVLSMRIKQISLISLNQHHALVIVVTEDGRVLNRHLEFDTGVSSDDLAQAQRYMNDLFTERSLREIEQRLNAGMMEAFRNPLLRMILDEVLSCLQEGEAARTHSLGMASLLMQPEFSSSRNLLPVMQVLEDDTVLLHVLTDAIDHADNDDVSVQIGSENKAAELEGVSVVASQYGRGDSAGVVAVIGPTRMDYSKVIQAVRAAKAALHDV